MIYIAFRTILAWFACLNYVAASDSIPVDIKRDRWESNSALACAFYLTKLRWDFQPASSNYYSPICQYEPAFGSWSTCIYDILDDKGLLTNGDYFEKSLKSVQQTCSLVDPVLINITLDQYVFSLHNASKYLKNDYTGNETLTYPVKLDEKLRTRTGNAYHFYTSNIDDSNRYAVILCSYVFGIVLVATCFRLFDVTAINGYLFRNRVMNYIRGYCTIPTLNGKHAADYVPCELLSTLLPTRLETLIIACFFIINVAFLSIGYKIDHYNIIFESESMQIARYVGDRSGIIAIAHMPLIILFSTRNNLIEYLTGFKYSTFIALHKWIGRSMILDVIVHSISYMIYGVLTHSVSASFNETYWRYGLFAMIILIFLLFLSLGIVRKYRYELFLYIHILLALLFFFCCWRHLKSVGWLNWVYTALAIWVLERIIRVIRILHFGPVTAQIQLIGDDLLRVTIPKIQAKGWKSQPGQYVFLHFMDIRIFWQSHPFTIIESEDELVVVVRAKKGATKVVLDRVIKESRDCSEDFITKMKVCIEGPYGTTSPLRRFDNLLLLCGGSGIPGPLAHAIELGDFVKSNGKRTIELIIALRGLDILQAYQKELLKLQHSPIHLKIYLTQSPERTRYGSISGNIHEQSIITLLKPFATFHNGRPDFSDLITTSMERSGSLAIVTCGPPVFVDRARDITANTIINNPSRVIEYFEEYQCW